MSSLNADIASRMESKTTEPRASGVLYLAGKDQIGALRIASDFVCLRRAKVTRTLLRPFSTFSVRLLAFEASESDFHRIVSELEQLQDQFPRCRVAVIDAADAPMDDRVGEILWLWVRGAGEGTLLKIKAALKQAIGPALVGSPAGGVVYHRADSQDATQHTLGVVRTGGFTAAAARELRQMLATITPNISVLCAAEEATLLRAA